MTKKALPGIDIMGFGYDIDGKYADESSILNSSQLFVFDNDGYNPDNDNNARLLNVYGNDYFYPQTLHAEFNGLAQVSENSSQTTQQISEKLNITTKAGGFYEGFYGSVSASFDLAYSSSSEYYDIVQQGLVDAYRISLPPIASLRDHMTANALNDFETLSPAELVDKYGNYFFYSGVFGGTLDYSQSIAKYSVDTEATAKAQVHASYLAFLSTDIGVSSTTDLSNTSTNSKATFISKGGDPATLRGTYEQWVTTVESGIFTLVGFDKESLQPISILAATQEQRNLIDAEIRDRLTVGSAQKTKLIWQNAEWHSYGDSTNVECEFELTNNREILIGFSARIHNDNVAEIAYEVLDLDANTMEWRAVDKNGPITYNAADFREATVDLLEQKIRGAAMVGLGLRDHDDNLKNIAFHYQELFGADNSSKPTYLDYHVKTAYAGSQKDSYEQEFKPGNGTGKIVVGIRLRVNSSGDIKTLDLKQATFTVDTVTEY